MALKALLLRKKIEDKKKELDQLRENEKSFETREAELEQAIEEAVTKEEKDVVEEKINQFEGEKEEHQTKKDGLEQEIVSLETDLEKLEREAPILQETIQTRSRKDYDGGGMEIRSFYGMNLQERSAFFAREDTKNFLNEIRTCIREKRALTNVGLMMPEVMLDLLKEVVENESKLLKYVAKRPVSGTTRQRIMGTIPEGIWTEMTDALNELDISFSDVEVDGYKIGGFFAVSNSVLEDNDVNLTSELLNALGVAIAKGLDKAILYGTGVKMPLGIVTRLAQTTKPTDSAVTRRKWEDLTSHLFSGTGKNGVNLFKELILHTGEIATDYARGELIWMMSKQTHTKLLSESMGTNMNAAIVSGMNQTMPVIGGSIIELNFIPSGDIIFGYPELYLLAERAGTQIGQSEHCRFLEDQTVFRGTARYDGKPVIPEGFGVYNLTGAPSTSLDFSVKTE